MNIEKYAYKKEVINNGLSLIFCRAQHIDLIAVISARKAKSRAQLTPMRTTVAYSRTKHCFFLDYSLNHHTMNALFGWYTTHLVIQVIVKHT
jgi:hypothetical protein